MGRMTDEDVARLLREIPRAEAAPDFTDRVLGRLVGKPRLRHPSWVLALALLTAVTLGAALSRDYLQERYERSRAADRVRELRDEYRSLENELEKLRALTRELEPVLELGGTNDVDFVIDLRGLAAKEGEGRVQPVAHSPSR